VGGGCGCHPRGGDGAICLLHTTLPALRCLLASHGVANVCRAYVRGRGLGGAARELIYEEGLLLFSLTSSSDEHMLNC
jgi:hypothetical protein